MRFIVYQKVIFVFLCSIQKIAVYSPSPLACVGPPWLPFALTEVQLNVSGAPFIVQHLVRGIKHPDRPLPVT